MSKKYESIDTKLVHAGEFEPRIHGAVSMPIFQSANFESRPGEKYHEQRYIRLNNTPNHVALHKKLAALENAEAALVTGSGMAAISTAMLTVLKKGDHLLAQNCLYGGTHDFLTGDFKDFGLEYDFFDPEKPDTWKALLKPTTKAIYFESITNPLMQVADLQAIVAFARENNLITMVDNTFASPVNFRPAEIGIDISLHSATKYLNGHSDIVGGVIIARDEKLLNRMTLKLNHLGGSMDPHACFLLHRGLKTLGVRVRFQNESARKMANFLEKHAAVSKVNYPGLESNAGHVRARELFNGFGGMLSFETKGGVAAAEKFTEKVTLPIRAASLGGVETLVTRPCTTSHSGMKPADREALGISDSLIRVSIGIEDPEDLIADFSQALQ